MDFSKYKYEQEKREREARKYRRAAQLKEVRFRPSIDRHDYAIKVSHLREFLEKGHKVRIRVLFRGREIAHPEKGKSLLDTIVKDVSDIAKVDKPPQSIGKTMVLIVAPNSKK